MLLSEAKRQLREFYAVNGVGIRRAEKLVKSDLRRALRNTQQTVLGEAREYIRGTGTKRVAQLDMLFVWGESPEGHEYWAARDWGRVAPEHVHA